MAIRKELMDELNERRAAAAVGGGLDKLEKRHQKGQLTARERIEGLYDASSFQESGMHVNHQTAELKGKVLPGDGVITGIGQIDGRPVAAFSQDFTVSGGSLGRMHAKKICDMMDTAANLGIPVVAINDSGGARIQEAVHSLSGYGQIFYRNVEVSGLVPQIAIIAGPCAGGAAYSPALMDFLIMTRKNSQMFICGPDVIKAATGQEAPIEQFGTAQAHASVSGNIHFIAEDDKHALEITRKLLSFLPLNNMQDPPHNIPIVNLVNVPGFMPGLAQERGGIIRHGAKLLFAYSAATVPKITMILGKSYGGAYLAMCSKDLGADFVYAWPTAEIAVMGAEGAVRVIYRKEMEAAEDPKAKEAELIARYRDEFASPYQAAENGMINDVIAPSETRSTIALALRLSLTKRVTRPPKKHGLIPL